MVVVMLTMFLLEWHVMKNCSLGSFDVMPFCRCFMAFSICQYESFFLRTFSLTTLFFRPVVSALLNHISNVA